MNQESELQGDTQEQNEYNCQENNAFPQVSIYNLAEAWNNKSGADWGEDGFFHFEELLVPESCMHNLSRFLTIKTWIIIKHLK